MLKIEDLCFSYGNHAILSSLNLKVDEGDRVVITGPSGSGKSTLLQLICGAFRPARGEIFMSPAFSYMTQKDTLLPWKTLYQNLYFSKNLSCKFLAKHQDSTIFDEILSIVNLQGQGDLYPYQLSGGMRQRASLAQAMLFDKPFLLLDEPFSSLDPKTKHLVISQFSSFLEKKKKTLLLITHDVAEIILLEAKHYTLNDGKLSLQPKSF